jgi:aryl-alcohol dehydrogenase-like predicted oxidoreductase
MMQAVVTRRHLLALAAAGGAANVLPLHPAAAQASPTMHTRPIPQSNEPLPVVGIGTWQAFDIPQTPAEMGQRKDVLRVLFDAGGTVIDSSPMYGRAEAVVGALLGDMQAHDKAFLATKVWTTGEAAGIRQMTESAAKMRGPIDLMQIHNLVDWRTHLRTLRAWKDEKRIRYIGLTHYTVPALDELAAIVRTEPIDALQFAYSIDVRAAEARLLPLAAERGIAVIVNRPFGSGSLFQKVRGKALPAWAAEFDCASWGQFFLKYILGHPAVTCVIPGTAKPDHARDNVAAGIGRLPDDALRKRMAVLWDAL